MTDNEIIKALRCCYREDGSCQYCPLWKKDCSSCVKELIKLSVDLINRQKAEIEELKKEAKRVSDCCRLCDKSYVERLKKAKSDAIKEFAEMLKSKFTHRGESTKYGDFTWDDITSYEIDNLAKKWG